MNQIDVIELKLLFSKNIEFDSKESIQFIQNFFNNLNLKENNNIDLIKGMKIFYIINLLKQVSKNISIEKSEKFLNILFNQDNFSYTKQEKDILITYFSLVNNYNYFSLDQKEDLNNQIESVSQFLIENNNYQEENYIGLALYRLQIILLKLYNIYGFDNPVIVNHIQELLKDIKTKNKIKYDELISNLNHFHIEEM